MLLWCAFQYILAPARTHTFEHAREMKALSLVLLLLLCFLRLLLLGSGMLSLGKLVQVHLSPVRFVEQFEMWKSIFTIPLDSELSLWCLSQYWFYEHQKFITHKLIFLCRTAAKLNYTETSIHTPERTKFSHRVQRVDREEKSPRNIRLKSSVHLLWLHLNDLSWILPPHSATKRSQWLSKSWNYFCPADQREKRA